MRWVAVVSVAMVFGGTTASQESPMAGPPTGWAHGWDTAADAWWGYGAMGGALFTDSQLTFAAKTYKIVVLSLCPGGLNVTTIGGVAQVSSVAANRTTVKRASPSC